ncbi:AraC family transcriptional regulator [Paenibacillus sp. LMG 31456]|uniref:AraC family transcriptional regulator n=1 Tax=Paenibacillus foliorum TaxID=2654974 RepID=A0A972GS72_9BACL|nr:AraC family transcriptional regulator [Paenibacillus foliorum]NOU93228.1 AraC family transcriptional regulator [Paenibacillus foliorum]
MLEQSFQVKLIRWYNTLIKRSFMLTEDTYSNWVILTADDGSFDYRIGEDKGRAKFGELILCPPGVTLYRQAVGVLSFLFIEFNWYDNEGRVIQPGPDVPFGKISFHRIDRFSSTFACIRELSDSNIHDRFAYKQHLLMDILYMCAAEHQDKTFHITANDPIIRTAVLHIQNNAYEPLSLMQLADRASLSQSQFSRRFQAAMGVTPIAYLTALRMSKASNLLLNTELTLEAIAQQCGYQNGFYLSRVFTNTYSLSPSVFRKTYRI